MRIARWWLAMLLVSMGVAQLSDFGGFADVLASYQALPGRSALAVALAIAVAEMVAGFGLLAGVRSRRLGAIVAVTVALVWSVLGGQAFARGLDLGNCGCFGVHLAQRLWWGVLAQDAAFLATTLWVARALRSAAISAVSAVPTPTVPIPTIRVADPFGDGYSLRDNTP